MKVKNRNLKVHLSHRKIQELKAYQIQIQKRKLHHVSVESPFTIANQLLILT